MPRILIVDPEPRLAGEITALLAYSGDSVQWVKTGKEAREHLVFGVTGAVLVDTRVDSDNPLGEIEAEARRNGIPIVLLTDPLSSTDLISWYQRGVAVCLIKPLHGRELVLWLHAILKRRTRVVCLGGGTGLYTLLLGLKALPNIYISSVVNMSDDGGSSGRIRESFGILPPGDVRRCLVALSTAPTLMNELLQYRFAAGEGLRDHNLGNLLLTAMTALTGSMAGAVRAMSDILHTQGLVLPSTGTLCTLTASLQSGAIIRGEHAIDVPESRDPNDRITRLWHEPQAQANPEAVAAILAADVVTIGPGDLFTSILATLAVSGIAEALRASRARKIYICNLMTKPGETSGFSVADHVREIIRYIGQDVLDTVVLSDTPVSEDAHRLYAKKGQELVRLEDPSALKPITRASVISRDIGMDQELVRHHSLKLANEIALLLGIPASPVPPCRT